ncbi:hypothetical protein LguiA_021765 [Lonicera macranthoides]
MEAMSQNDERRVVRSGYIAIQNLINVRKDDIARTDSNKFMSIIQEVEGLHQLVKLPREQVTDAETLLGLATNLVAAVKSYASGITPSDFVSCLLRDFGQQNGQKANSEDSANSITWKDIGFSVSPIFRNGRGLCTMFGAMNNEAKQRKVSVRRKRARPTESARPEELDNTKEEKADTDKNMVTMFEILKKKKNAKLESLLLNRKSFAQTVENLFALSFLVKDGRVVIVVDEKGSQIVSPRNAPASSSVVSGEVKFGHFVFRLDFKDWKLMMDLVPEEEELMPFRVGTNFSGGSPAALKPEESQALLRDMPIKKYSRNRGLVIPQQFAEDQYSAIGNFKD